jgi:S1-C subfamily serine protease
VRDCFSAVVEPGESAAYPQLRDYGHLHPPLLGMAAQPITPQLKSGLNLSTDVGMIVADVTPGGPAAEGVCASET